MNTKNKFLLLVIAMLLSLTLAVIVNVGLNFREFAINSAVKKAKLTAEIVKDGLTAHMVNGIMAKRQYFLDTIMQNKSIKQLRVIRGENVNKQFGPGFADEAPLDSIDKEVLKTGKMVQKLTENADNVNLRITIPYKAVSTSTTTCIKCHHVKSGSTLGAISMDMNIDGIRNAGTITLLKIFGINIIFLILVLLILNYYITPYMTFFTDLKNGIKKAHYGDFSYRIKTNIKGEAAEVATQINTLFDKMQEAFGQVKHILTTFVNGSHLSCTDPLYETKIIIKELADIYKFKKTIELDRSLDAIYARCALVLQTKFALQSFTIYELDKISKTRKSVYSVGKSHCDKKVDADIMLCRAYRTNNDVVSTDFPSLCENFCAKDREYVCLPYNINDDTALVIEIVLHSSKEVDQATKYIADIENYLEAAKPVIESKILTDKLRETTLRDGMTELYNRRFLEEFIDKAIKQAQRDETSYAVMMLDIDFFKMVNDTYGHDVGDKVIKELANVIKNSIRSSDLAIRYGGEEFLVLLYNPSHDGVLKVAQNIHDTFNNIKFQADTDTLQKTISIGISMFPHDTSSIWKAIKLADVALYYAKEHGRDQIVEFTKDMYNEEEF